MRLKKIMLELKSVGFGLPVGGHFGKIFKINIAVAVEVGAVATIACWEQPLSAEA
jgi:hypothetical protein